MKLEVLNIKGESLGREVELPANIFGLELNEKHDHVVYLAVKQFLANQRQGTHKAKGRAEITGSTKKIKRQKGTGTARAGSIKSPVFRGGGRVFGPEPRSYGIKLNKKVKTLARKSVLSSKAQEGSIIIVEDVNFDAPKTKEYIAFLSNLKLSESKKSLLVLDTPAAPAVPAKPVLPSKTRGAKAKAGLANAMKSYSEDLVQNKSDVIAYEKSLESYKATLDTSYDNVVLASRNVSKAAVADVRNLNVYEVMNANTLVISESALTRLAELFA